MISDINDLIRIKGNILLNLSDDPDPTVKNMIKNMNLMDLVDHIYSKDTTVCKFIETEIIRSYVHKRVTNDNINNESIKNVYRIHKRYYFVDPHTTNWKNNKNLLYESTYDTDLTINLDNYVEVYNIDRDNISRDKIYELSSSEVTEEPVEIKEIPEDHINIIPQAPIFNNVNGYNYTNDQIVG